MSETQQPKEQVGKEEGKVINTGDGKDDSIGEEKEESTKTALPEMNEYEKRLFDLRLKMNQARKANQKEVEEEFKRISNKSRRNKYGDDEDEDADGEDKKQNKRRRKQEKPDPNSIEKLLTTTAVEAEWISARNKQKEEIAATYGLSAFTTDASYRAYEKRVAKLEKNSTESKADTSSSLELNPFDYGRVNTETSPEALERLRQDVLDREEQRRKFSRRRMHTGAEDVDYINDKNAQFNQKLKKAFDKYTVEIRQNLERGTAI